MFLYRPSLPKSLPKAVMSVFSQLLNVRVATSYHPCSDSVQSLFTLSIFCMSDPAVNVNSTQKQSIKQRHSAGGCVGMRQKTNVPKLFSSY